MRPTLPTFSGGTREIQGVGMKINLLVNWLGMGRSRSTNGRLRSDNVSPLDLIVRLGGGHRLSGFHPVQSVYADFYVRDEYWPDLIRSILSTPSPGSKTKIKHSAANSTTRHCLPLIRPMTPIWPRYVIIGSPFLLLFDRLMRIVERNIGLSGVVSDETRIVMRRLPYAPCIILLLPA
jgi:hypothetical protein